MPIDPAAQMILDAFAALPALGTMDPVPTRELFEASAAPIDPIPMESVEDRVIPGPGGDLPIRIYSPFGKVFGAPGPVMVFFHGGGWVVGSINDHDRMARRLADDIGCVVVSVGYRLAPEHKYPAAADDSYAATEWVAANAASLNVDPDRLIVCGDSAGGNLATVVALRARDENGPKVAYQLLIYPVTGTPYDGRASYVRNGEGYLLTKLSMEWFTDHYARSTDDHSDPYFAPINAKDLSGLPPAHIITGEFDPLCDEGEEYGARLLGAGVPTTMKRYDGQIHAFMSQDILIRAGREAFLDAARQVRAVLG